MATTPAYLKAREGFGAPLTDRERALIERLEETYDALFEAVEARDQALDKVVEAERAKEDAEDERDAARAEAEKSREAMQAAFVSAGLAKPKQAQRARGRRA